MIDITQYKYETLNDDYGILLLMHVSYIFMLPILLINFLIALLSHSISELMETKDLSMLMQKLYLLMLAEQGIDMFWLVAWQSWLQKKHFHVENGKIYLKFLSRKGTDAG